MADLLANPGDTAWMERSVEFCGGTHLSNTADAGGFVLLSEQGLAAGVRRVIGLAGEPAAAARATAAELATGIERLESADEAKVAEELDALVRQFDEATISVVARQTLGNRVDALRAIAKKARKAAAAANRGEVVEQARSIAESATGSVIVGRIDDADKDALLSAMDAIRSAKPDAAVLLVSANEDAGSVAIVAKVPEALVAEGLKAGEWVKVAAQACGGGGGGRPDSAQAGGKDPARAGEAVDAATIHATNTGLPVG